MPRINAITLDQLNRQFEKLDIISAQINDTQRKLQEIGQSVSISDPIHAVQTTNNLNFVWSGVAQQITWVQGFVKDKNWAAQTVASPAIKSSAKGQKHLFTIPAGTLSLVPSTYYWLGWDPVHQKMLSTSDVSVLHGNYNVHVLCQIYTGTVGQSGTAGGGGSTGGVDLSGARYKNF